MLKNLLQKLTNQPSEERMRSTLELFRAPGRIRSPGDAFIAGGLVPLLPQQGVRSDN